MTKQAVFWGVGGKKRGEKKLGIRNETRNRRYMDSSDQKGQETQQRKWHTTIVDPSQGRGNGGIRVGRTLGGNKSIKNGEKGGVD